AGRRVCGRGGVRGRPVGCLGGGTSGQGRARLSGACRRFSHLNRSELVRARRSSPGVLSWCPVESDVPGEDPNARNRTAARPFFLYRACRSTSTHGSIILASAASTKHLFVTGGVASSLGKGLTASSLGRLLKSRGLRVTMQKLDPYLNVD